MHQAEFLHDAQPDLAAKKDINSNSSHGPPPSLGYFTNICHTSALLSCGFYTESMLIWVFPDLRKKIPALSGVFCSRGSRTWEDGNKSINQAD